MLFMCVHLVPSFFRHNLPNSAISCSAISDMQTDQKITCSLFQCQQCTTECSQRRLLQLDPKHVPIWLAGSRHASVHSKPASRRNKQHKAIQMLMQDLEMLKAQGTQVSEERLALLRRRNSTSSINHHVVLGVSCRASIAEIKAAHR